MGKHLVRRVGWIGDSSSPQNALGDHFSARDLGVDRKHFASSGAIAGTGRKPCLLVAVDRTPVLRHHGDWAFHETQNCRALACLYFIPLGNPCNDPRLSVDRLGFELLVRVCVRYRCVFLDHPNSHQPFHSMVAGRVRFFGIALVVRGTACIDAAFRPLYPCDTHRILSSGHADDDCPVSEGFVPVPISNDSGAHGNRCDLLFSLFDTCARRYTNFQSRSATHGPRWPSVAALFRVVIDRVWPDRPAFLSTV